MPRTRPHLDRIAKVDEILDAAVRRLIEGGYGSLSMADIARELGLAQNAVYWYFPSKDHLFIAALERIVQSVLAKKPRGEGQFGNILWFVDRMQEFHPLRAALRDRATQSAVVAQYEKDLFNGMRMLLSHALGDVVPMSELERTTDAALAFVEGVLSQSLPRRKRNDVLRFGLSKLTEVG